MHNRHLISKIIAYTREIRFFKGRESDDCYESFFVGNIGLTWYPTRRADHHLSDIVDMLRKSVVKLHNADRTNLAESVRSFYHESCGNTALFDPDTILLGRCFSLFDARVDQNANRFGQRMMEAVVKKCESNVCRWLIAMPISKIVCPSFSVPDEDLHLMAAKDNSFLRHLVEKGLYRGGQLLRQPDGLLEKDMSPPYCFQHADVFVLSEERGIEKSAVRSAKIKFQALLSVMFSELSLDQYRGFTWSDANPADICLGLPEKESGSQYEYVHLPMGQIIPAFLGKYLFTADHVAGIIAKYGKMNKKVAEDRSRICKGAHYINEAMNRYGSEAFILNYIALDAFFGVKGQVERSIKGGIIKTCGDSCSPKMLDWFFALRNDLVHGGIRFPEEWSDYEKYRAHFGTEPTYDLLCLSLKVLGLLLK